MKNTGINRKIDKLGRIVIPKELRQHLCIRDLDRFEFYIEGDCIELRKVEIRCFFCSSIDNLIDFKGKKICRECIRDAK